MVFGFGDNDGVVLAMLEERECLCNGMRPTVIVGRKNRLCLDAGLFEEWIKRSHSLQSTALSSRQKM